MLGGHSIGQLWKEACDWVKSCFSWWQSTIFTCELITT